MANAITRRGLLASLLAAPLAAIGERRSPALIVVRVRSSVRNSMRAGEPLEPLAEGPFDFMDDFDTRISLGDPTLRPRWPSTLPAGSLCAKCAGGAA